MIRSTLLIGIIALSAIIFYFSLTQTGGNRQDSDTAKHQTLASVSAERSADPNIPDALTRDTSQERLQELLFDQEGNYVDVDEFLTRLDLDESFDQEESLFRCRVVRTYLCCMVQLDPENALSNMLNRRDLLFRSEHVFSSVVSNIASLGGFSSASKLLSLEEAKPFKAATVKSLVKAYAAPRPLQAFEFLENESPELLRDWESLQSIFTSTAEEFTVQQKWALLSRLHPGKARGKSLEAICSSAEELSQEEWTKFYQKMMETSPERDQQQVRSLMLMSRAKKSPELALKFLEDLPEEESRNEHNIIKQAGTSVGISMALTNVERSISEVDNIESNEIKYAILGGILKTWASYDPRGAANYAFQADLNREDQGSGLLPEVLDVWFNRDTHAAYQYLQGLSLSETEQEASLAQFVETIGHYDADLAIKTAQRITHQEAKDSLITGMTSTNISSKHPEKVEALIDEISNPNLRSNAYFGMSGQLAMNGQIDRAIKVAADTTNPQKRDELISGLFITALETDPIYAAALIDEIDNPHLATRAYQEWLIQTLENEPLLANQFLQDVKTSNPSLYEDLTQ